MQDRRLREQLQSWKSREKVVVHFDRLAALGMKPGSTSDEGISPIQEPKP
jgi:hypothetical protein